MVARLIAGHLARTARRWVGVWERWRDFDQKLACLILCVKNKKKKRYRSPPSLRQTKRFPSYPPFQFRREGEREKWPTFMRVLILPFSFHFSLLYFSQPSSPFVNVVEECVFLTWDRLAFYFRIPFFPLLLLLFFLFQKNVCVCVCLLGCGRR